MKVFKIRKYHALYSFKGTIVNVKCVYTLCSRSYSKPHTIEIYNEEMDLCKTCKKRVFEKMVNKLKGKDIYFE